MERNTKQRSAIRDAITEAHGPVSAREVLDLAQRRVRGMGMATVYRTLKALVTDREIVQIDMPGEQICECGSAAAIGHMRHLCAGLQFEQFTGQMDGTAKP